MPADAPHLYPAPAQRLEQAASVAQFPAKMGSMGIDTAVKAARGENVPPNVDTGTEMVTKDNVDQFK